MNLSRYLFIVCLASILLVTGCQKDDPVIIKPAPDIDLQAIMDGVRPWFVESITSDLPVPVDSVFSDAAAAHDWLSAMVADCNRDNPYFITFTDYTVFNDDLTLELHTAKGLKCSDYEMPYEFTALGTASDHSNRSFSIFTGPIHSHLYGYNYKEQPAGTGLVYDLWQDVVFEQNHINFSVDKEYKGVIYRLSIRLTKE